MLELLQKPKEGNGPMMGLTEWFPQRRYTKRAIGGYDMGEATLVGLSRTDKIDFYNQYLGNAVAEWFGGSIVWEGIIYEMRLVIEGQEYFRSLRPEYFANNVYVRYMSTVGTAAGTGWSEDTASSGLFGRRDLLESRGGMTATGATQLRDTLLSTLAWPGNRAVAGANKPQGSKPGVDALTVIMAGFWHTLNWRYRATSKTDTASNLVTTLVGASEFVTAGVIETNATSMRVDCVPIPQRIGDLLKEIAAQGDSTNTPWQLGVYAGRELRYAAAPTAWQYQVLDGQICDRSGQPQEPALIEPGFWLYDPTGGIGGLPAGATAEGADSQIRYVDEIEFDTSGNLVWHYQNEQALSALLARVQRGNV
jgi:hypothetical protein